MVSDERQRREEAKPRSEENRHPTTQKEKLRQQQDSALKKE
jgi:hypothetical protein